MQTVNSTPVWGIRSASWWMIMLVAIGLLFIGLRFLFYPAAGATGFGIPFHDAADAAYGRIKGIRDIYCGILLCILLALHERRLTGFVFGAAIIIPFTDGLIVLNTNGIGDVAHLSIHWGTVLFALIAELLLLRHH